MRIFIGAAYRRAGRASNWAVNLGLEDYRVGNWDCLTESWALLLPRGGTSRQSHAYPASYIQFRHVNFLMASLSNFRNLILLQNKILFVLKPPKEDLNTLVPRAKVDYGNICQV